MAMGKNTALGQAGVFLDLQGTLGGEGLDDIRNFTFFPFAIPAIKLINKDRLPVIIITNQSHIAGGHFSYQYFQERMTALRNEVKNAGASIDAVYCCPHRVEDGCQCMKPRPGLVLAACKDMSLDVARCYVVSDTGASDMILAHSVGCKKVLVKTGLGESSLAEYRYTWQGITPDFIANDVLDAAKWIVADRENVTGDKR